MRPSMHEADSIYGLISAQARKHGDRPFLVDATTGHVRSYSQFAKDAWRVANAFIKYGTKKGESVCFMAESRQRWLELFFGAQACGLVTMSLNPELSGRELSSMLSSVRPNYIVVEEGCYEKVKKALDGLDFIRKVFGLGFYEESVIDFDAEFDDAPDSLTLAPSELPDDQDTVIVCFSAGSTGKPSAIPQSGRWLIEQPLVLGNFYSIKERDVLLSLRNTSSVEFSLSALCAFETGATLVLLKSFSADSFLSRLKERGVSVVFGTPSHLGKLISSQAPPGVSPSNVLSNTSAEGLPSLRYFLSSSSTLLLKTRRMFTARFPHMKLADCYFSAEAGYIALENPDDHLVGSQLGAVGRVLPHLGHKIVDDSGKERKPFEVGELVISSDVYLMKGYLNVPAENRIRMRKDGFHTGDLCSIDNDDYLFIHGRKNALIIRGTDKVAPQEVDAVIKASGRVEDCLTLGVPDPELGEEVVSFVVVKYGMHATERDILEHCAAELAAYKCPKHVVFLEKIPLRSDGSEKPDVAALVALYEDASNRPLNVAVDGTEMRF